MIDFGVRAPRRGFPVGEFERHEVVEEVREEEVEEVACPSEVQLKWFGMIESLVSPLEEMRQCEFEGVYKMDASLLRSFVEYFEKNGPDAVEILKIMCNSKVNCLRLVQFGILEKLFVHVPKSFPEMLCLIRNSHDCGCNYFVRQGGIDLLVRFFEMPEFRETIGEILVEVSQTSADVEFEEILIPPSVCPFCPEFSYLQLFEMIFDGEDAGIIAQGLRALQNILPKSYRAANAFKTVFLAHLPRFLGDEILRRESVTLPQFFLGCGDDVARTLVEMLFPVAMDEDERNSMNIFLFFEKTIHIYGLSVFPEEKIDDVIARSQSGTYAMKLQGMWVISEVIKHSGVEIHKHLIDTGALQYISDVLNGTCCNETLLMTLETLRALLHSQSLGIPLTEDAVLALEEMSPALKAAMGSVHGVIEATARKALEDIEALLS